MTGYSECRDVPSPPHTRGGRVEDGFVGRVVARTTVSCLCMPMYPGPPPGCVPGGFGYEFGFTCLRPSPRRNPTGSKSPGSGSF